MAQMVRKQIYIPQRQQALLKRLARLRGVSEAELIRQAIDHQISAGHHDLPPDHAAWEDARAFMLGLRARLDDDDRPLEWDREDLYEERLSRHDRHPD